LVLISDRESVDPRAERIKSVKNASDTIGFRTRHLPAYGAVPPTTTPPRVSELHVRWNRCFWFASNILYSTVVPPYPQVIRSKTYRGYVKGR
jgi:hypothetical protein